MRAPGRRKPSLNAVARPTMPPPMMIMRRLLNVEFLSGRVPCIRFTGQAEEIATEVARGTLLLALTADSLSSDGLEHVLTTTVYACRNNSPIADGNPPARFPTFPALHSPRAGRPFSQEL